jgi:polyisoprenoid-binding protein YceI
MLLGTTLLALPAVAQMAPADPAKVPPGTYDVEPYHTRIMFAVNHMGFSTYFGDFTGASGKLTLAPKAGADALDITVPVASVSTTNAKLDSELKAPDWFDAGKYPTMTFKSTKVTKTSATTAKVAGDLTLHGVTKPVTLSVKFHGAGVNILDKKYTAGFDATGIIKRSDFGVSKYVPLISDEVTLTISGAFEKQG